MREINMTLDEVATLYHRVRPRYLPSFFDLIENAMGAGKGYRVLELGSGTGIATAPMLERGWIVDCVEPGASLAVLAGELVGANPNLTISVSSFEDWVGEVSNYDAIVSATAFHWIDRAVRYVNSHRYLKPGGHLAVMHYRHVAGGDESMFDEIQNCYQAHMPKPTRRERLALPTKRTQSASQMRRSGLFDVVESTSELVIEIYTRLEYLDLISTYSGHRMLEAEQLEALRSCIGNVIDRGGGSIRKAYAHELVIGRHRDL